jgi:protein-tyrosine phosphatase
MGLLDGFFKKKLKVDFDFSTLEVDMHSHLIPGIDDGAATLDDSIEMIRRFHALGIRKIITTPHIKNGVFDNTSEIIKAGEKLVKEAIAQEGIDIEFEAAAEYFFDYSFMEKIVKDDLLSFSNRHVLVEYSFGQTPMGDEEMFFELQMKQYHPILAHFERYPYYHGSLKKAESLRNRGIKIQLNFGSIIGHYGPQVQKQAELMLKEKMVDLISSDCHRIEHLDFFEASKNHPNLALIAEQKLWNGRF